MLKEIYNRVIKAIVGDGSTRIKITPSPNKRLHALTIAANHAGGTNTLVALMLLITEIRVLVGTKVKWRLNGTELRDWMLLHGTGYDFNGVPNTALDAAGGAQFTIPFAPEWYLESVANALAWNPQRLGGPITVEIDSTTALTLAVSETISDDLDAPSFGIITQEVIKPNAAGTAFYVREEIDPVGKLLNLTIYPDSTNARLITPCSLFLGKDDYPAHEAISQAKNDEILERRGLTPNASGRTADVYDIVPVKQDLLAAGWDLEAWGQARLKIEAAAAMAGTSSILITRLERN